MADPVKLKLQNLDLRKAKALGNSVLVRLIEFDISMTAGGLALPQEAPDARYNRKMIPAEVIHVPPGYYSQGGAFVETAPGVEPGDIVLIIAGLGGIFEDRRNVGQKFVSILEGDIRMVLASGGRKRQPAEVNRSDIEDDPAATFGG